MPDSALRERFGRLLETAGQMYWEMDTGYRVIYANQLLKDTFGDPVGRKCYEFMAGGGEPCDECPVGKVYAGAARSVSERPRRGKDGSTVWLQHTATPIRNGQGELVGACELVTDTTHRRELEQWLRDQERLYRNLVEQVPDIIFSLDRHGRFSFVNTQVEAFLGYRVQHLLETPLTNYVSLEDRPRLESIFGLEPEAIWDEEVGILDAQGSRKFARIRCKASFEGPNGPIGFDGVMRDRTDRRKLEEELRRSKEALIQKIKIIDELYEHIVQSNKCRAIAEHTAEVAHELRQPLAIVGGFARRMAKQMNSGGPLDVQKHGQYTQIIIAEIQRLEQILNGLIDFTQRGNIHLQTVNPNDLIRYIVEVTEDRIEEKSLLFALSLGAEIGDIPLDPGRFQQLVLNVLS
ncbi:MAG: PAS domain-containing sensor histidine kinase, partial [Pseudomonadota bacterium]